MPTNPILDALTRKGVPVRIDSKVIPGQDFDRGIKWVYAMLREAARMGKRDCVGGPRKTRTRISLLLAVLDFSVDG